MPLTAVGEIECSELGAAIRAAGLLPDVVLASPLDRTQQTGRRALLSAGIELPILLDDDLQEVSQGVREGLVRASFPALADRDDRAPGGESLNEALTRMHRFQAQQTEYQRPTTVFAFGHSLSGILLIADILGWSDAESRQHQLRHCSSSLLRLTAGEWSVPFFDVAPSELAERVAQSRL